MSKESHARRLAEVERRLDALEPPAAVPVNEPPLEPSALKRETDCPLSWQMGHTTNNRVPGPWCRWLNRHISTIRTCPSFELCAHCWNAYDAQRAQAENPDPPPDDPRSLRVGDVFERDNDGTERLVLWRDENRLVYECQGVVCFDYARRVTELTNFRILRRAPQEPLRRRVRLGSQVREKKTAKVKVIDRLAMIWKHVGFEGVVKPLDLDDFTDDLWEIVKL